MKYIRYFAAADQSARYYIFSEFAVKKVKYRTDWSERTNQLTITLFFTCTQWKKWTTMLIGQSEGHELLPRNHRNENWI